MVMDELSQLGDDGRISQSVKIQEALWAIGSNQLIDETDVTNLGVGLICLDIGDKIFMVDYIFRLFPREGGTKKTYSKEVRNQIFSKEQNYHMILDFMPWNDFIDEHSKYVVHDMAFFEAEVTVRTIK